MIINYGLEKAYNEKNNDSVDSLVFAIYTFELFTEKLIEILCKLSKEEWHGKHEDIASYFQKIKSPKTIECIYELAISDFEKYRWDDNFALVRKCCFALGDINTPKAKKKLELIMKNTNEETIKEHVMEQLNMCDFSNKDI